MDGTHRLQHGGQGLGGAKGVLGVDSISIHGAAVKAGYVLPAADVLRQDPAQAFRQRHGNHPGSDGAKMLLDGGQGVRGAV